MPTLKVKNQFTQYYTFVKKTNMCMYNIDDSVRIVRNRKETLVFGL